MNSAYTAFENQLRFQGGLMDMTKYFAAANTEKGFQSLFSELFSPETHRRIYILKGGPGTGKSTLIKGIGLAAQSRGYDAEYFYCSSDTDSLDGVRIPALGIAVVDGTAPHTADPLYPGAIERIVDLGLAFDCKALEKKRKEIVALAGAKTDAYRTAYRFLSAAGRMAHETDDLLAPVFLSAKAEAAAQRIASSLKKAEKGSECRRYISAIGTRGCVTLDTLRLRAKRIYGITGKNGLEYLFMNHLYAALARSGVRMTVCMTPLVSSHLESIYVEGEDILFSVMSDAQAQKADKIINCVRFAMRERLAARRAKLRFAEKCEHSLIDGALTSLAEAGRLHGELEAIYGECTDFDEVNRIKTRMISEIFENNM